MKLILTGATGNTGGHALTRLLSLPAVTEIVVLSRRALSPPVDSAKVTTLILTDEEFYKHPPRVVEAIKGASGAVWTLGALPERTPEGMEKAWRIGVGYPQALINTVLANPPLESGEPFRFVFTSGGLIPEDPNASLWIMASMRQQMSTVLQGFHKTATDNPTKLDLIVAKPWFIRPPNSGGSIFTPFPTMQIPVDILAAALVDIAVNGSSEKNFRNEELKARGVEALKKTA
ncbi:hypothetical protein RQP46_002437 [Phenoliferia psychrophenolica]